MQEIYAPSAQLGDLELYSHQARIAAINATLDRHLEARDGSLEQHYQTQEAVLRAGISRQQEKLRDRGVVHALQDIAMRYKLADTLPASSPLELLAHRLAQFDRTHIVSDFDCSMTWEKDNIERNFKK